MTGQRQYLARIGIFFFPISYASCLSVIRKTVSIFSSLLTFSPSKAKHDRDESPEKPITSFEGTLLLFIFMLHFKSNFCMVQNYVAFTVRKNTGILLGHDAQLPWSFPCQERESRTISTLDRWVSHLLYLAQRSLVKKSKLVENYTQICHCSDGETCKQHPVLVCISSQLLPESISTWVTTDWHNPHSSQHEYKCTWCNQVFGSATDTITCWGDSAFSQIHQSFCSFTL